MKDEDKIFCYKPANMNIEETSCILYINQHSMQDYMSCLILHTIKAVSENEKSAISDLESNYKHIFSFWFNKAFEKPSDVPVSEVLLVLLSDAIGWLRTNHKIGESPIIRECLEMGELLDKDDLKITDEEFLILLKTNNVHHRRCDVCGCDLPVPDRATFSRKVLQTMACTACTDTKAHRDLLIYVEELRKKHDKATVIEILDDRMDNTWGKGDVFTVEEWKKKQE